MSEGTSFLGMLKGLAITAVAIAGVGGAAYIAAPKILPFIQSEGGGGGQGSEQFNKTAYDANGVQLTGPVPVGQVIQYVLRYGRPNSGTSGPATINDTLSASQTYVPNSIVAPGWSASTPEYQANHEVYSSPGIGPTSFTMTVPVIAGSVGAASGGGDGYEPVPVVTSTGTKVFGINHHQPTGGNPSIMCWYGGSLQKCSPAYPKLASTLPDLRATPDFPHAAVFNKKVYYPTGVYPNVSLSTPNQTIEFGIACWDAELDMPCPFIPLTGHPTLSTGSTPIGNFLGTFIDPYIAGVRADPLNPSHLLMYAMGKIYCVDVGQPGAPSCAGWSDAVVSPTNTSGRSTDMFVEEGGTRVFFSNTVPRVFCFNIADGSVCSGWPTTGTSPTATGATNLGPGLNASGTMDAICLSRGFASNSGFECFDIATSLATTSWPVGFLANHGIFSAYHLPMTKRVLFPAYTLGQPLCYDFGTASACAGFTPYWTSPGNVKDYGYEADPTMPQTCIYGLGDGGKLVRFDANGASALKFCVPKTYSETYTIDDQFCFKKPSVATWTTVAFLNRPSELVGGTIVLKDSAGTVIQTITVNSSDSYALNLSALGLNSTVTMDFTPNYSGSNLPTSDYQIELSYSADEASQICYKATVSECGAVSNDAVLHDDLGTYVANVDLGQTSGPCGGTETETNCLDLQPSMLVNPDGSGVLTLTLGGPPGFGATLITLEALTGGIGVTNEAQTFGQGQTQGVWALTGLVPGTVVTFKVDGVEAGGGIKPGTDQCCNGTIEVTVPDITEHVLPHNVVTPPLPPEPACDKRSTKTESGACVCRYQGMKQKSPTSCSCPSGTKLVAGEGCVKKPLACDKWSTKPRSDVCACLYQGMSRVSPTMCECAKGQILVKGVGCVVPKQSEKPTESNKVSPPPVAPPVACGAGTELVGGQCVPVCKSPMVLDPAKNVCGCPDGMEAKGGTCEKKSNLLDDVLGNVHFGFGIGDGGRSGSGGSSGGAGPIK